MDCNICLNTSFNKGKPIDDVAVNNSTAQEGEWKNIPLDLFNRVLNESGLENLPNLALVCKDFKEKSDSEELVSSLRNSMNIFGAEDWKTYANIDAGKELKLPRRAYGDAISEDGILTFIPTYANRVGDKKKDEKKLGYSELTQALNNVWTQGRIEFYFCDSPICYLEADRPHWVLLSKKNTDHKTRNLSDKFEADFDANKNYLYRDITVTLFTHCRKYKNLALNSLSFPRLKKETYSGSDKVIDTLNFHYTNNTQCVFRGNYFEKPDGKYSRPKSFISYGLQGSETPSKI